MASVIYLKSIELIINIIYMFKSTMTVGTFAKMAVYEQIHWDKLHNIATGKINTNKLNEAVIYRQLSLYEEKMILKYGDHQYE